jgi:hypothetical protein
MNASGTRSGSSAISGSAPRAASIRLGAGVQKKGREQVFRRVNRGEPAVVTRGISTARDVPIVVSEQRIAEHARIADRKRESLSPGRVAGCGSVADERDAISVWLFHPAVRTFEGG